MAVEENIVKKTSFKKTLRDEVKSDKLADLLKKEGQITNAQLADAKELHKKIGGVLTTILIQTGAMEEEEFLNFVARHFSIPIVKPAELPVNPNTLKLVPFEQAAPNYVFPIKVTNDVLTIAMVDPTSNKAVEETQQLTGLSIKTALASEGQILEAYKKHYRASDEAIAKIATKAVAQEEDTSVNLDSVEDLGSLMGEVEDEISGGAIEEDEAVADALSADAAPIIKLVNNILIKAIKMGVSDIHIEPFEKSYQVRYRLDGTLFKSMSLPLSIRNALVSRIKILSSLNIAERRVPQDGRIKLKIGKNSAVDFRVSCLPTLFGESIVMRILDKSALKVDFGMLGFTEAGLKKLMKAIRNPYGLVLVTGPTGSGKTTTLYSSINYLNNPDVKILTAEDPVEFNFAGINQVLVRNEVGMTFAAALKAFLRQDPEIILVGEIRDMETAEIAIKAAMTGHLVFSTLHTNDCPSTVGRLLDIGIPGFMVASAVTVIVAQRLLKKICGECREEVSEYSVEELIEIGFNKEEAPNVKTYKGKGCPRCNGTGYKGRVGLYEIMEITEALKQAITAALPEDQIRKTGCKEGMLTLREEGLLKIKEGVTTVEEVLAKTVLQKDALPGYLLTPDELVFDSGDLIIQEGNTDKNFYRLVQGALSIYKNDVEIATITQPGEYFGEIAALLDQPRNATVKAKGKAVVKVFPGDKLKETLDKYPEISLQIINSFINRLQEADKKLASLKGSDSF